ncbi:hypothetical protein BOX15_Mlig010458g2, partial [Macrostomum lignano]
SRQSAAALCAKALAKAGTDNDRVAALLLTARQLAAFSAPESSSVFAHIDTKFLLRLLLVDRDGEGDGDDADTLAHVSAAASIIGHLAERDLAGLAGRADFPDLLNGLCRCLARWQPAAAQSEEIRQLVEQLHQALYFIACGLELDQCREFLADSPLVGTLVESVLNRLPEWDSSLRLALVALDRCAFAGMLDRVAPSVDKLLSNLTAELVEEFQAELSKTKQSDQGNSSRGESQGKSPTDDSQGKTQSGESQGKSSSGESQGKSPTEDSQLPGTADILEFVSQLLSYVTPNCVKISSGRLTEQLRPLMPSLLGNRSLRAVSLSLLANLASASKRGLADIVDSKASSGAVAESELLYLIGSLAALEVDVRLNLADESDRAFELVIASSQHRETLGACFVLLEETIRRLLEQQQSDRGADQRPDYFERLLTRLSDAFDLLLDRLVAGASAVMKSPLTAAYAGSNRPQRLFLAACSRCLCLWLSEGDELAEQIRERVGNDDEFNSKSCRKRGAFVQLLGWLMGAEGPNDAVDSEDADDVARAALPYLCTLTSSDDGVELLRKSSRQLVRYLMSDCLARQLAASSSSALSPLANVLLNLTLGQMHSAEEDASNLCFDGQQLTDMIASLTDYLTVSIGSGNNRLCANNFLSILVLGLASLRLSLLLNLSPTPSCSVAQALIVNSLRHIVSCSPNEFDSNIAEDADDDDEDGIGDLQLLVLRLTGELLSEHSDSVQASAPPIPELLCQIINAKKSAKVVSEDFDSFVQTVVEFSQA